MQLQKAYIKLESIIVVESVGSGGFAFANSEVNLNEDNLKEGYFKLFRSFFENPLWTKPRAFSEAEAWIDILYAVRWKDEPEQIVIGCKLFECNRGESLKSLETWKSRWHWNSRRRVSLFLKLLEKMGQIRLTNETVTTRLFVINYKRYQDYGHASDTGLDTRAERERNASGTRAVTEEEPKKEIKEEHKKESLVREEAHSPSFDAFWNAYPASRRVDKKACWHKWKDKGLDQIADQIMKALENHKASEQWNSEEPKIVNSTTWLNQSRWNQVLPPQNLIDDKPKVQKKFNILETEDDLPPELRRK
jgi:hypothetical protein